MRRFQAAGRLAGIAGVSAALYGAYRVEGLRAEVTDRRLDRYVHLWAQAERRLLGVEMRVEGQPAPVGAGGRLVVCNHRSAVDIVVMLDLFGGQILARGDMAEWPLVGPLVRAAGTLFVDREESGSRATAVRKIRERLMAGRSVTVFAEGTTYPGDEVRPFHPGAFLGVTAPGSIVQPVGLAYQSEDAFYGDEPFGAHMKRVLLLPRVRVAVAMGAPIPAGGPAAGRGARRLCEESREAVQGLVLRARAML